MVTKGTGQEKWGDQGGLGARQWGVWLRVSVFIFFGAFLFQSIKKREKG